MASDPLRDTDQCMGPLSRVLVLSVCGWGKGELESPQRRKGVVSVLLIWRSITCTYIMLYVVSCRNFKGFNDAEGTKEFLFALPRFARDEVGH